MLVAVGVPCRVERRGSEWALVVGADDETRASAELAGYDEERTRNRSPRPAPLREYGWTWLGAGFAVLVVAFASWTGPRSERTSLFRAGEAHVAAIADGEWWRVVTALTLHADATHLLGNVVIGAAVATLVSWSLGPGVGAWMLLLSGAAGNGLAAWTYEGGHRAVGASTAVFGGVGVLVGLTIVRGRRRAWVPLAAGFAILGLLGTSERADLFAHLYGFLAGTIASLSVAPFPAIRSRPLQWLLAASAVAAICACWWLAAARGGAIFS